MFVAAWPDEHVAALKQCVGTGMSFAQSAADINAQFGTSYSRNACIGKARRIGVSAPQPKPKSKIRTPAPEGATGRRPSKPTVPPGTARAVTFGEGAEAAQLRIKARHISIHELTDATCKWPFGDRAPYTFCGCRISPGSPYCKRHLRLSRSGESTWRGRGANPKFGEMLTRLKRKSTNSTRAIFNMINTGEDLV